MSKEGALHLRISATLYGFGHVGREFVRMLHRKRDMLEREFGLDVALTAVVTSRGGITNEAGLDLSDLALYAEHGGPFSQFPGFRPSDPEDMDLWLPKASEQCRVVVDASASDLLTGEPALSRLKRAAAAGCHIITLNKAPLVADFPGLTGAAEASGVVLKFSGATAAGLPTLDTAVRSLAGAEILVIEGVLNATTNYILTSMSDEGLPYSEALTRAQALGLAETDPGRDVEGLDTACKILLLANAAMRAGKTLDDVSVQGITQVTRRDIAHWAMEGRTLRLVGRAVRNGDDVSIEVKPTPIPNGDFLAQVRGDFKAVRFVTDIFGELTMVGGAGGPRAASATALKDLINLGRSVAERQG
ncbi:MAG: hypothetical protein NUW23_12050 [Firmicutes bacterium]|jgi:homoserine dehydrogenase|nr:hypothetical protein [Bacillota bacterium]